MVADSTSAASGAPHPAYRRRLIVILAVGAAAVAFCRFNPFFDNAIRFLSTLIASLLTLGGAATHVFIWSRFSGKTKIFVAALVLGAGGLFLATTRAEYKGDLQMRFVPRQWVLRLLRKANIDVGDVIHIARLADPPLVLNSTPEDVPQFFGPHGDGVYAPREVKLVRDWAKQPPRQLWRNPIGKGWSSFAVVGDYAFTQEETTDFLYELVTCYGMADGKLRWAHADAGCFESSLGGIGPRATPTVYDGKVLTVGGLGRLNCLEAATGRPLWNRNPLEESDATMPDWGISASPLVYDTARLGPLVVVSAGGNHGNSLHAYRLDNGHEVWSVGDDSPGYCSPMLRKLGGVEQVVLVNWQAVTGHHPETGAELWRYAADDWVGGQPKVPQPIVLDDRRVLISAGYGTGCVLLEVTHDDGKWSVKSLWKSKKLKPKFTSPVVCNGFVYGLDDGEFLVCLDLANGDLKWRSSRGANYGHGQVLLIDDLLLVQTESGDVVLVAADPEKYQELSRTTVLPAGISWNLPVLFGRKLLVRNDVEAALYELPIE